MQNIHELTETRHPAGFPRAAAVIEAEALKVLDEVKALRELVEVAERLFEGEGLGTNLTREEILSEALICAHDDIDLLQDGNEHGVGSMMFVRAKSRVTLALKLADYRERFGTGEKAVAS
jgi:hypothetical protein